MARTSYTLRAFVISFALSTGCRLGYELKELDATISDAPEGGPGSGCGNGVVQPPLEACDDNNDTAGDGCSPTCTLEDQGPGSPTCMNPPLLRFVPVSATQLGAYATGVVDGSSGNEYSGSCQLYVANDVVYAIEVERRSDLLFEITPGGDGSGAHHLRGAEGRSCLDPMGEVRCGGQPLTLQDAPPGVYYLIVDFTTRVAPFEYRINALLTPKE